MAAPAGSGTPQAHPPTAAQTRPTLVDELHPSKFEGRHYFGQTLDDPANGTVARFHALDRWKRYAGRRGQGFLVHAHEDASSLHLRRGEQYSSPTKGPEIPSGTTSYVLLCLTHHA